MGTRAVQFLGRSYYLPGARGAFRAKPQAPSPSLEYNTMIIIGAAENGWNFTDTNLLESQRVMEFGSSGESLAVLGKGDLADACHLAFSPSKDTRFPGAQIVKAINVSTTVAASASAASNTVGVTHTMSAINPGLLGNTVRFRVTASGSVIQVGDAKDITTSPAMSADEILLQYTGNGTSAILEINSTHLKVSLTGQTDGSLNLNVLLDSYPTIGELVDFINAQNGYIASVISQPDRKTEWLDHVLLTEAIDISTATTLTALLHEQESFLSGQGLCEIVIGSARKPLGDMAAYTYLSGGSASNPSTQDYIDAIDYVRAKKVPGFFLNVCSVNAAVANRLAEYMNYTNTPDGSFEHFGAIGIDTSLSYTARIDAIKAINSEFVAAGASPVTAYRADGITEKTFDGWMIAVLHNAIKASANMRETPTYKSLNIISCPEIYSEGENGEAAKFVKAGGLIVDRKPGQGEYKINFALTTYQKTNIILNQTSLVCTALAMVKFLREALQDRFTGEIADEVEIRTFVDSVITNDFIVRYGWLIPNQYTGAPAFDFNYTIERDGDAIYFVFPNGNMNSPINFMFFLLNLDVVRGTSTGA